jgi:hypothetical protein
MRPLGESLKIFVPFCGLKLDDPVLAIQSAREYDREAETGRKTLCCKFRDSTQNITHK